MLIQNTAVVEAKGVEQLEPTNEGPLHAYLPRADPRLYVVLLGGALAVFGMDRVLPLGFAAGVLYLLVLLGGMWLPRVAPVWGLGSLCCGLIWLDYALSPPSTLVTGEVAFFNRLVSTLALAVMTWLVVSRNRQALQETRVRGALEEAQQVARLGNWELDRQTGFLTGSEEAFRLLGLSAPARLEDLLEKLPEADREAFRARLEGTPPEEMDVAVGEHILRLCILPGSLVRTGTVQDVTARSRWEREREELLRELQRKTQELEQIVFISAHDLRSPLVNLQGFSGELRLSCDQLKQLLADHPEPQVGAILDQEIPEALNYIEQGTQRMQALLAGLLRLSRLGRQALRPKRLDMTQLVQEAVSTLAFRIQLSQATVEVAELPACVGDELLVSLCMSNLLDNALKYHAPGRPPIIRVSGQRGPSECVYCVQDQGIGVELQQHARIFEIFARLNPRASEGEGLGLTIVQRSVERLGGRVWLESTPGQGTTFFVALPSAPLAGV